MQYSKDEAFIGTKERGIFYLRYDTTTGEYIQKQISDKGQYSISNKNVKFIATTQDSAVWIGTKNGLNILKKESLRNGIYEFEHYLVGHTLNAFVEVNNHIWLATDKKGIAIYDKSTRRFKFTNTLNQNLLPNNKIKNIYKSNDHILVSFANMGLMHYNIKRNEWHKIKTLGSNIKKVYFDRSNNAWITSDKFGITKFNLSTLESKAYQLTEESQKSITDQERHFFFEDHNDDLWIGLHGGGLAFYNKKTDSFFKYINIPKDSHSLPSNIVHCITEDHSGQMWLGTGQNTGGLVKVIKHNPAFQYAIPTPTPKLITDNLVRCIYEDPYQHIWAATKSGAIHIYNQNLEKITTFNAIATDKGDIKKANIYSIYVDQQKHLWIGSKGHGLFVSKQPLGPTIDNNLKFYNYTHQESSIAHNNIYSIEEDKNGHVWIGTYGNGVSVVYDKNYADLTFVSYNTSNTNITNDQVRKILCDSDSNIWIATTFGLNMLAPDSVKADHISFHSYFKENNKENKICYNDIIDVYEDSQNKIWFGSIGGGVSFTQLPADADAKFSTISKKEGLSNNSIYGIAEDRFHNLWLSSGNGLNKLDPDRQNIAIFRTSNGLSFNNFSESTKCKLKNGRIVFGGSDGITLI
ncbi:MAG: hypothetical protein PF444_08175, partial [Bacteroidales bacterium]|nr:hypothetical protein [Bacteroidales bacterium]